MHRHDRRPHATYRKRRTVRQGRNPAYLVTLVDSAVELDRRESNALARESVRLGVGVKPNCEPSALFMATDLGKTRWHRGSFEQRLDCMMARVFRATELREDTVLANHILSYAT